MRKLEGLCEISSTFLTDYLDQTSIEGKRFVKKHVIDEDVCFTGYINEESQPDGLGTMNFSQATGKDISIGRYSVGKRVGKILQVREEGTVFCGMCLDDLAYGKGEEITYDDGHYIGEYKNGEFSGTGKFLYRKDPEDVVESYYEGDFKHGESNGYGTE